MLVIAMLILLIPLSAALKVWCERVSQRRWFSKNCPTAEQLAKQSPTQLCLPESLVVQYEQRLMPWLLQIAWLASAFLVGVWLWSSDVRSKTPNDPSSATAAEEDKL